MRTALLKMQGFFVEGVVVGVMIVFALSLLYGTYLIIDLLWRIANGT